MALSPLTVEKGTTAVGPEAPRRRKRRRKRRRRKWRRRVKKNKRSPMIRCRRHRLLSRHITELLASDAHHLQQSHLHHHHH
jgi:hypothetical protein